MPSQESFTSENRPQNYQGTLNSLRLLKDSPSEAFAASLKIVESLAESDTPPSIESGYEGWTREDFQQLLVDLETTH